MVEIRVRLAVLLDVVAKYQTNVPWFPQQTENIDLKLRLHAARPSPMQSLYFKLLV